MRKVAVTLLVSKQDLDTDKGKYSSHRLKGTLKGKSSNTIALSNTIFLLVTLVM